MSSPPQTIVVPARGRPTTIATVVAAMRDFLGLGQVAVPPRVATAIRHDQETSEILVGLTQIGAIVMFAILYALTPKAFPPSVPFEPVPWTLGFYAGFTAIRLYLALRRALPRWFLRVSVVLDIAVLMLTIWSFHIQYQAPPSVYLKAPTFAYAFIMIGLRALRFEVGLVLLAGASAMVGWAVLIGWALADPRTVITHNFLEYATSPKLLLGAELDKLVAFAAITAITAIAIARARQLLARAVAEQQAAMELSRFFAPDVARTIRSSVESVELGMAQTRDAAILMTDLRGFTPLAQTLSPAATLALLAEYQSRIVPIVQAHGGSIDKYLGDGILASFGATRDDPAYAAHALRAAEEILRATAAWREERRDRGLPPVEVGLAVASGPLVFGTTGHESRLEYTVIGEPVNLAAKLEKHTKAEGVRGLCPAALVAQAVLQGGRPPTGTRPLGPREVAGVGAPIDLVALTG
jgi:adenylate cyclase